MATNQNSFIFNNSKKLSSYRPNSSSKKSKYCNINNCSFSNLYPAITFTMPTQKRKNRMGNQITKEELYEENMNLKEKINKMRKELDEIKNKFFKKDLELKKKEKLILDYNKENVTDYSREINIEKAKESSLLTMCKQKYNEMKKQYQKKCKENDILKANIKLTKIKEFQIKIDVMKKEMEKLKILYNNSQINYQNSLKEIKKLEDIKDEFFQQHSIIDILNKKNKDLSNEMKLIQQENILLKKQINKNNLIQKRLKKSNLKLKISNEKFMNLKKIQDNSLRLNTDNTRQIQQLKKNLAEYKLLYSKQSEQYNNLLNRGSSNKTSQKVFELKPFNTENVKEIEKEPIQSSQSELYKSLLDEAKIKNKIFETFLIEHDINPEQILKGKGYEGIMNLNTNQNMIKLTQKFYKTSTNNSTNTKDATSVFTKDNHDISKNLNISPSKIENNNLISNQNLNTNKKKYNEININNNINDKKDNKSNNTNNGEKEKEKVEEKKEKIEDNKKQNENQEEITNKDVEDNKDNNQVINENQDTMKITQSQNSEYNIQELQNKENQLLSLLHTFVKNLEANHITKENLINKIKQISILFEHKEEATKEEFIEPFVNLFIESMKVTQSNDIQIINEFFNTFIDDMEGDTNRFFLELIDIFENIVDYTLVENEEEVLNAIAMELQPYKDDLKLKLEKYDNNIITFDYLRNIIEELNISLTDDYTEFLIYKMKEKVPENSSIFDLNCKIILDLLDKSLNSNVNCNSMDKEEKKIKEEEKESKENYDDEEMNILMSNKLSELKQAFKDNNTTLSDEFKDKIKIIEDENNKKTNGLNKDVFFDVMKKYNIDIENKIKEAIFDLFKIENINQNEQFLLDYDKLCSIL